MPNSGDPANEFRAVKESENDARDLMSPDRARAPHEFPDRAREQVVKVALEAVVTAEAYVARRKPADVALGRFFSQRRELGARDRRFVADLVFSFFRWRGWIADLLPDRLPLACAIVAALDAEECSPLLDMLLQHDEQAPRAIEPMGRLSLEARSACLSAVLGHACPIESLIPEWVVSRLWVPGGDPAAHVRRCIESFQGSGCNWERGVPVWLYALRGGRDALIEALARSGITAVPHLVMANALRVAPHSPLRSLPASIRARFLIQDLSSQCVARVCDPQPGQRWLDVCAGAGGKTLHLADAMADAGEVVATDVRARALRELYRRSRLAGLQSVRIGGVTADTTFDGVLVDAPCSGLGTWARNPDARWRTGPKDVVWSAQKQTRILDRAAKHVRPGGILVYSVCTLTRAETVDIIERFCNEHSDFQPDRFVHPLSPEQSLLQTGSVWIWPWDGPGGGMFIARLRRRLAAP